MEIELLYWAGCPSHPAALADLHAALAEQGLTAEITLTEVRTDRDARERGFIGSPTIRVDGEDLFGTGAEPPALTCRVYRLGDGRFSPTPDPKELRELLAARH